MHRGLFVHGILLHFSLLTSLGSLGIALLDLLVSLITWAGALTLTSDSLAFFTRFPSVFLAELLTRLAGLSGKRAWPPETSFCAGLKPLESPIADLSSAPILDFGFHNEILCEQAEKETRRLTEPRREALGARMGSRNCSK